MKRILFSLVLCGSLSGVSAQTILNDTAKVDVVQSASELYRKMLPLLDRVEFSGNSSVSQDIRNRWNRVVNHLKSNSGNMAREVKDMLVSPSGLPIDLDLLTRFISVKEKDSVKTIDINMDFLVDEMKAAGSKVTEAAKKMAETK